MAQSNSRKLKTTARTLDVVQVIEEENGARVVDIADQLDMSPGTVHAHLATLEDANYIIKENGEYRLSLRFLKLGKQAQLRKREFRMAEEYVNKISEATGLRSNFIVEEHGRGAILYKCLDNHKEWRSVMVGSYTYLHASAAGKAYLSQAPRKKVEEIIDQWGLPKRTENTITDAEEFLEELEVIRERGFAINRGEHIKGVYAVGVPVLDSNNVPLGSLSTSGPMSRIDGHFEEISNTVSSFAKEFEIELAQSIEEL